MYRLIIVNSTRCKTSPWGCCTGIAVPTRRQNSTRSDIGSGPDLITRLQSDLKEARKAKCPFTAKTIRSVLAEIYAAQKEVAPTALKPSEVNYIVRKAEQRRHDSRKQFESASRLDLALGELAEAKLLAAYLPAMLSFTQIDDILRRIISERPETENVKKAKGLVLKSFYEEVDKSTVSGEAVRQRLDELWSS